MENCNLLFGILIISAMLYIIILNNPSKEHYRGAKGTAVSLVSTAVISQACKDSDAMRQLKINNRGTNSNLTLDSVCLADYECKSSYCLNNKCRPKLIC